MRIPAPLGWLWTAVMGFVVLFGSADTADRRWWTVDVPILIGIVGGYAVAATDALRARLRVPGEPGV